MSILPSGFDSIDSFNNLLRSWLALQQRHGCNIPAKSMLEPVRMTSILSRLSLLEVTAHQRLKVRLTGTALDEALRRNLTGTNLTDLYDEPTVIRMIREATTLLGLPCGLVTRHLVLRDGRAIYDWSMLHLPLADDGGRARYIISVHDLHPTGRATLLDKTTPDLLALELVSQTYINIGFGLPA